MSLSKMLHLKGIKEHIEKKKAQFRRFSRVRPPKYHISPLQKERGAFMMRTDAVFTTRSRSPE